MWSRIIVGVLKTWAKTACVLAVVLAILCACGYVECHYCRKDCVVVEVERGLVTVEDKAGHVWSYYVEDRQEQVGDVVDVYMHTNHTDNYIYDDEILRVEIH